VGSRKATARVPGSGGPERARQRRGFWGQGRSVEHRGLLRDWDDTRSSPHPSVVALGCLDGRDERGGGQGCYSRRLGQWPGTDTASGVEFKEELGLNLLGGEGTH
jgi:hypothetical protein